MDCSAVESPNRRLSDIQWACPIQEKQRKFYFVTVNSNTPSDQAESSTSCYRVTTLYIPAKNLPLVFVRQCPECLLIDLRLYISKWKLIRRYTYLAVKVNVQVLSPIQRFDVESRVYANRTFPIQTASPPVTSYLACTLGV